MKDLMKFKKEELVNIILRKDADFANAKNEHKKELDDVITKLNNKSLEIVNLNKSISDNYTEINKLSKLIRVKTIELFIAVACVVVALGVIGFLLVIQ
jgi:hypothetical protein